MTKKKLITGIAALFIFIIVTTIVYENLAHGNNEKKIKQIQNCSKLQADIERVEFWKVNSRGAKRIKAYKDSVSLHNICQLLCSAASPLAINRSGKLVLYRMKLYLSNETPITLNVYHEIGYKVRVRYLEEESGIELENWQIDRFIGIIEDYNSATTQN